MNDNHVLRILLLLINVLVAFRQLNSFMKLAFLPNQLFIYYVFLYKKKLTDEEWDTKRIESVDKHKVSSSRRLVSTSSYTGVDKPIKSNDEVPPSYLYPSEKPNHTQVTKKISANTQLVRTISADLEKAFIPRKEEEIRPKLVRPRNLEAHFKQIMAEKRHDIDDAENDNRGMKVSSARPHHDIQKSRPEWKNEKNRAAPDRKALSHVKSNPMKSKEDIVDGYELKKYPPSGKTGVQPQATPSPPTPCEYSDDDDLDDRYRYRENLTDRQKYRESLAMEKHRKVREREHVAEPTRDHHHRHVEHGWTDGNSIDRKAYRPKSKMPVNYNDADFQRNPYQEPDSLPYRESIERMIKSPAMRYKSFEGANKNSGHSYDYDGRHSPVHPLPPLPPADAERYHHHHHAHGRNGDMRNVSRHHERRDRDSHSPPVMYDAADVHPHVSRQRYRQQPQRSMSRSPDMAMSPGRYDGHDKEKYRSVERDLAYTKINHTRRVDTDTLGARSSNSGRNYSQHNNHQHSEVKYDEASSEEDDYRHGRDVDRSKEHFEKNPNGRISSSRSLGNLVKGYRHSYAEPRAPMPRNSGRVGLAAVNPFGV